MTDYYGLDQEYYERHFADCHWADPANVPGADAASWRLLNRAWAVDATSVFFNGKRIKEVDRASFRVLNELYARDDTRAFCTEGSTAAIVDPASFEVLDQADDPLDTLVRGYARDRLHVYFAETFRPPKVVKDADPASFESLRHCYGRDSKSLYFEGKPVRNSKSADLEFLDEDYVRAGQIFVNGKAFADIDYPTFQHLGFDYFADCKNLYWAGHPMEFVHRKTFVATGYGKGRDKHRSIYQEGRYESEFAKRMAESRRGRGFWKSLWFWIELLFILLVGLVCLPYGLWKQWRDKRQAKGAKEPHDVEKLARAIAPDNKVALAPVLLAIHDMPAFRKHMERPAYADEPDYEEMMGRIGSDDEDVEPDPFLVFETVFNHYGLLGVIDWRSGTDETQAQIDPMLARFGIDDFDWSFIDVIEEKGEGPELANHNFLSVLRDELATRDLKLIHVNLMGDSYGFTIVRPADFPNIDGLGDLESFSVSDDFGADRYYKRAKAILKEHRGT